MAHADDVQAPPGDAPFIVIEREPFGWSFDVVVLPASDGIGHDREFSTYNAALEYATELARVTGWRLRDLAGD